MHSYIYIVGKLKRNTNNVMRKHPDTKIAYIILVRLNPKKHFSDMTIFLFLQGEGTFQFPDMFGKYNRDEDL